MQHDEPKFTNRLAKEKSPYLRQHAHNPVDWYPWGNEAFQKARVEDKPIFLSIGYATCHWCHVMERESFENQEIAEKMNLLFVNVKVDREELPEVDSLYMEFAQSMLPGSAGWPLNVILTPDLKPFFAATYLPAEEKQGMAGMHDLIARITELWNGPMRGQVIAQANRIVQVFQENIRTSGTLLPSLEQVQETVNLLYQMADPIYGGLRGAPKFPIGYHCAFMLRFFRSKGDMRALFLVERNLDMMARGGIFDHIGGGFSRYSVDERWRIPHFEKMLYDNAILAEVYLEAWQITEKKRYLEIAQSIAKYILRDLSDEKGGFYSAEDADTEGQEGLFYTWTEDELNRALSTDVAPLFGKFYGVTAEGNFEGRNVLHTTETVEEFAASIDMGEKDLEMVLTTCRAHLFTIREERERPFRDEKIVAAWNGLALGALARLGFASGKSEYVTAAVRSAEFIEHHLIQDGTLLRRFCDGEARFEGGLDDYAFVIRSFITLFELDLGTKWLQLALKLTDEVERNFKADKGAYFQAKAGQNHLILRKCQFSDGAEPSGNAVHAENLLRLSRLTGRSGYKESGADVLKAASSFIKTYPPGYCYQQMVLQQFMDQDAARIVIALNEDESGKEEIKQILAELFIPHATIVWRRIGDHQLFQLAPDLAYQKVLEGKTTLYVCREGRCELGITKLEEMKKSLENL